MSSQKKKKRKSSSKPVQPPPKKRFPVIWVSVMIVLAVAAIILAAANLKSPTPDQAAKADAKMPQTDSSPAAEKDKGFGNLIGRWLRPDGGYIIEIRGIGADGRIEAGV